MNRSVRVLKRYAVLFALFTAAGVTLRCISLFKFYDASIGYYVKGAILPMAFHILSVVTVAMAALLIAFLRKKNEDQFIFRETAKGCIPVGAAFGAAGVASYVIYALISLSGEKQPVIGSVQTNKVGEIVSIMSLVFGVLAVIYFVLVLVGKTSGGDKHVIFGYAVILFVLMVLAKTYFDFNTTMNSPNKLLVQVTLMLFMLYFLYEFRFSLGNSAPGMYAAASFAAFYYASVCAIPGIIGFFAGVLRKPEYLICDFLALGLAFYIGSRIAAFINDNN